MRRHLQLVSLLPFAPQGRVHDTGIVDEHIQPGSGGQEGLDGGFDGAQIGEVDNEGLETASGGRDSCADEFGGGVDFGLGACG